jgi:hypothetical protein
MSKSHNFEYKVLEFVYKIEYKIFKFNCVNPYQHILRLIVV